MIGRYRGRVGVVIGACAFLVSVFVMSLFIWSVDITGCQTVSRTQMLADLREQGLYVGAFKPLIDPKDMKPVSIAVEEINRGLLAYHRNLEDEEG